MSAEPTRAELEASLARHRVELRTALVELRQSAVATLAPSEHLRRHPWLWLGAAAALGFLWGRGQPPLRPW